jgi:hypothetical protein
MWCAPVFDFRQQTPQDHRIILPAGLSSIIFKSKKEFGRLSGVVWGEGRIGREGRAGKGRGGFFGGERF